MVNLKNKILNPNATVVFFFINYTSKNRLLPTKLVFVDNFAQMKFLSMCMLFPCNYRKQ